MTYAIAKLLISLVASYFVWKVATDLNNLRVSYTDIIKSTHKENENKHEVDKSETNYLVDVEALLCISWLILTIISINLAIKGIVPFVNYILNIT